MLLASLSLALLLTVIALVTEATQELVKADAKARQEVIAVQRELVERDAEGRQELNTLQKDTQKHVQQQGQSLDRQREQMEAERRQLAQQRNRDPIIASAIKSLGILAACMLPLAFCIYLLRVLGRESPSDADLTRVFIEELTSDRSLLLPPSTDRPALGHTYRRIARHWTPRQSCPARKGRIEVSSRHQSQFLAMGE